MNVPLYPVVAELRLKPTVTVIDHRRNAYSKTVGNSNKTVDIGRLKNYRCAIIITTGRILH